MFMRGAEGLARVGSVRIEKHLNPKPERSGKKLSRTKAEKSETILIFANSIIN
jgi:hypothetical protein